MFLRFIRALFGTANDRMLKKFQVRVPKINALEPSMEALDDASLAAKTQEFRDRLAKGETLDALLPEAFAVTREASKRVLGMRHFDVQLIGGMVLHSGRIAEMRTGEGKTLCSTLAVYLNALTGKGVHVVTVNDYLAERDAADMGALYKFLGLTTGVIMPNMPEEDRKQAYAADITYGTNNEFGFDYLRDNMKYELSDRVQRPFYFAIVDEVDSILIDEARTPLIISGPAEDSSELYHRIDGIVAKIVKDPANFEKDEKFRTVILTDQGSDEVEALLKEKGLITQGDLYDLQHVSLLQHVQQALRAYTLFSRDVDYMVRGGKIVLVDEFTGRMMAGRRYSEGLHQALEAKENVEIQRENQTLASVTFQNFFRLYPKLAGMTGTAMTEADEFSEIYNLDVVAVPTNRPVIRKDEDDEIYLTQKEKTDAIVKLIKEVHARHQPVLVGTTSIEKSESLSHALKKAGIKHHVLNARFHEKEAGIIAQAGAPDAITIATNMAGRGTDIKLGGNVEMLTEHALEGVQDPKKREEIAADLKKKVKEGHDIVQKAGGLFVIGTERHESRRIDNQLRGRSGRQGDPGNSRFFISLEDDLMRIFGSDKMAGMFQKMGMKKGEAIVHPWLSKALERAQKRVESRNFDMRKNTLKYDDVMNDQRKEVYARRREFMAEGDVSEIVKDARDDVIDALIREYIPEKSFVEQWDLKGLAKQLKEIFCCDMPLREWIDGGVNEPDTLASKIASYAQAQQDKRLSHVEPHLLRFIEKQILLTTYDGVWKEHLHALDQLRQGIGLRAYGQKDPLNEYKHEAFALFTYMISEMRRRVTSLMARVEVSPAMPTENPPMQEVEVQAASHAAHAHQEDNVKPMSRNMPCYCGSGKKYKHCHGRKK